MRLVVEEGFGRLEVWNLQAEESVLRPLLEDVFSNYWEHIVFGPLLQGAAFELAMTDPPARMSFFDGYLTLEFGACHFHLCVGHTIGDDYAPTPPMLARHRRTAEAYLFRRINSDGTPDTWGLRLFNGANEQQITVLFPNPFLETTHSFAREPDWSRLFLWDYLRDRYLGIQPDARDREGRRMIYP